MNRPKSALAALLLSVVIVAPAAAQQAPLMPQPAVSEFCSGCFAYLEFSPSLEPESDAMRGQETETPNHCLPKANRATASGSEGWACLPAPSSSNAPLVLALNHKQGLAPCRCTTTSCHDDGQQYRLQPIALQRLHELRAD